GCSASTTATCSRASSGSPTTRWTPSPPTASSATPWSAACCTEHACSATSGLDAVIRGRPSSERRDAFGDEPPELLTGGPRAAGAGDGDLGDRADRREQEGGDEVGIEVGADRPVVDRGAQQIVGQAPP